MPEDKNATTAPARPAPGPDCGGTLPNRQEPVNNSAAGSQQPGNPVLPESRPAAPEYAQPPADMPASDCRPQRQDSSQPTDWDNPRHYSPTQENSSRPKTEGPTATSRQSRCYPREQKQWIEFHANPDRNKNLCQTGPEGRPCLFCDPPPRPRQPAGALPDPAAIAELEVWLRAALTTPPAEELPPLPLPGSKPFPDRQR